MGFKKLLKSVRLDKRAEVVGMNVRERGNEVERTCCEETRGIKRANKDYATSRNHFTAHRRLGNESGSHCYLI